MYVCSVCNLHDGENVWLVRLRVIYRFMQKSMYIRYKKGNSYGYFYLSTREMLLVLMCDCYLSRTVVGSWQLLFKKVSRFPNFRIAHQLHFLKILFISLTIRIMQIILRLSISKSVINNSSQLQEADYSKWISTFPTRLNFLIKLILWDLNTISYPRMSLFGSNSVFISADSWNASDLREL